MGQLKLFEIEEGKKESRYPYNTLFDIQSKSNYQICWIDDDRDFVPIIYQAMNGSIWINGVWNTFIANRFIVMEWIAHSKCEAIKYIPDQKALSNFYGLEIIEKNNKIEVYAIDPLYVKDIKREMSFRKVLIEKSNG